MKNKKGQLWISAVLYIALGVVAITLVLAAGLPLINKMKDKNTVFQAKEMLNAVDQSISDVRKEGVGSKRFLNNVIIKGGEMNIDAVKNRVNWKIKTNVVLVEPCTGIKDESKVLEECLEKESVIREGNIYYYETETIVKDEYYARAELAYSSADIETNNPNPLSGKYSMSVENVGVSNLQGKVVPKIMITVT